MSANNLPAVERKRFTDIRGVTPPSEPGNGLWEVEVKANGGIVAWLSISNFTRHVDSRDYALCALAFNQLPWRLVHAT